MPFNLFVVVFFLGGWAAGRMAAKAGLPSILGMVLYGIGLRFFAYGVVPDLLHDLAPFLKSLALVVILLRAGLGIRKATLMKVGRAALPMAVIPCLVEAAILTAGYHYLFGFPLAVSALGAFMLAAVSPAVVVPSMLDFKERGLGRKNEVPTIVLAGASVDDVVAITFFSLFLVSASGGNTGAPGPFGMIFSVPLSILGGILGGVIIGFALAAWFKRHYTKIRATEKTLLLLMVAIVLVEVGDTLHLAALLGVMTVGFILLEQAEPVAHELAGKLGKVWVIAEIVLFVLIGLAVDLSAALQAGAKGLLLIGLGLTGRSVGVIIATAFEKRLTPKERIFCLIAYLPKATVQAALGAVPLSMGIAGGEVLLSVAVLSIVVTAPLGLLLVRHFGPRLLDG